ncbi:MAG: TetR/AcrR family transcriptional regulator [Bacteroidetes bacterium]|nr:TetR/AcrR family transcriptional regulator [Bacteroidota bacterium]
MPKAKDDKKIEAIFGATLKLVLKDGFSGLRMSDVAKEARIATGTLYIYFRDKHELINELYLSLKKKSIDSYVDPADMNLPIKKAFDTVWKKYFLNTLQNPEETAFIEQYYRSPFLKVKVKEEAYQLLTPIYQLLERGKKEQLIKHVDNDLLIAQISGPIAEIVRMHQAGGLRVNDSIMKDALQLAWDSVKK